ncbi:phosphoglucomutase [Breznakia sp. PF5-3]|uniref:phospho-sugar mutase n=1 Tax=unclassified Breznakia TaxID=2623764 RepID=UPI002404922B|nr:MULTISPECIES: phospho-sugar mutase [unclassified Breznakia]MDF9824797.1 phosphoglucomutase [Breznakia sp. PM6-1]MDF9835747.1 phosphoglucomutase [Breznakia sp. PF5-3]MDF9837833.1 phosphoglucomutase [Breznakia sp. PFB2-8]MDF9859796.1 phosphoglucomutase [Breznakia sp. PH5-24]
MYSKEKDVEYLRWIESPNLDEELRKELDNMSDEEIHDSFYTNIEFGTAGMRGLLGPGTNRINVHTIAKANVGFAKYIRDNGEEAKKRGVAIAYDNRHMSYELAMVSAKVLATYGIRSYVFESLRPTPELSFATRYLNCFGGIVVTASHNPKEYNGYKLYDEKGCQLIPSLVEKVIAYVNEIKDELAISFTVDEQQEALITMIGKDVDEAYYKEVLGIQLQPDIDKSNVKIVFTPQHGTANIPVQEVFKRTGYHCIPVVEQCSPDPNFSNTKTPNPEESASYDLAIEYAKKHQADIVLSCDPDADRMGVVVDQNGSYILLTGNQSGALLLDYILHQLKEQGKMPPNPVMFNTVVTGDLGEKVANAYGVECEKTLTGFKFIGEKIAKYEVTNEKQYVFGYEESYGSLIKPFVRDKDAVQACLMLAEATVYYKQQGKTLYDVLNDLYEKHGYYEESQVSLTLEGSEGAAKIKEILKNLRAAKLEKIGTYRVTRFEDFKECIVREQGVESKLEGFSTSDVLKYFLEDGSWIAIRPSGTEPKCKFYYCIKGSSGEEAHEKANILKKEMEKFTK